MTLLHDNSPAKKISRPALMHIMHVVLSLDVGGLERVVLGLAREAQSQGHTVSILCLERLGVLGEIAQSSGIRQILLNKKPGLTPGLVRDIQQVLKDQRPTVLHTHQIGALLYAGRAGRRERVPAILHTQHGNNIAIARTFTRRLRVRLLWWFASRYADRFCCVSKDIIHAAGTLVGQQKLSVIDNGIPVGHFDDVSCRNSIRNYLGITPDAIVIGVVARLSEEKSQGLLIRAFANLPAQTSPHHLLLVGDGPLRSQLTKLATELGIQPRVHFAGYQSEPQKYLQAMDIFALTSRMEGMPLAILEAWAARLPVIASAVGGIPDMIQDKVSGLLFSSGDQSSLEKLLLQLMQNPNLRTRLGIAGRAEVEAKFSTARMANNYQLQYARVLQSKLRP